MEGQNLEETSTDTSTLALYPISTKAKESGSMTFHGIYSSFVQYIEYL